MCFFNGKPTFSFEQITPEARALQNGKKGKVQLYNFIFNHLSAFKMNFDAISLPQRFHSQESWLCWISTDSRFVHLIYVFHVVH